MAGRADTAQAGIGSDRAAWRQMVDTLLREVWPLVPAAQLEPKVAAEACEASAMRLAELLDDPTSSVPDWPVLRAWFLRTLLSEIRRTFHLYRWRSASSPRDRADADSDGKGDPHRGACG